MSATPGRNALVTAPEELPVVHAQHKQRTPTMWRGWRAMLRWRGYRGLSGADGGCGRRLNADKSLWSTDFASACQGMKVTSGAIRERQAAKNFPAFFLHFIFGRLKTPFNMGFLWRRERDLNPRYP